MNEYKVRVYANDGTVQNTFFFGRSKFSDELEEAHQFSKYQIHKDDSIAQIKTKILLFYPEVSYDEVHLFAKVNKHVSLPSVYQNITNFSSKIVRKNGKEKTVSSVGLLDRSMFKQLLINLGKNVAINSNKEYYEYKDLLSICLESEFSASIGVGLGMHFSNNHNFLYSANPFKLVSSFSPNLLMDKTNNIYFFENELLFNNGIIENNEICVVFASDAFDFAKKNNISEEYISKTYFPNLATKGIYSKSQLDNKHKELLATTKKNVNVNGFESVDLFYNLQTNLEYKQRGIRNFKIALRPEFNSLIPLDAIFKNIHATEKTPFIKYNPGSRRENIYRLYSTEITKTGKKIPSLARNKITTLANSIGKNKQISIYEKEHEFIVDLESDGVVYISGEFEKSKSIVEMEAMLKQPINDILEKINGYLQNSGYKLPILQGLNDENVDFLTLNYVSSILIGDLSIKLKNKIGCLSAVFDIIDDSINKEALMRFKRIENFQEMDAQSALITEVFNSSRNEEDVIEALVQNYNITVQEAALRIAQHLNNVKYIERKHGNKSIDIIENPGLKVSLKKTGKELTIQVDKIPHIEYINTLGMYFDGLIHLFRDDATLSEDVKKICNKKMEKSIPMTKPAVIQHIDQVVRPKAFDINDFIPVQKQISQEEDEELLKDDTVKQKSIDIVEGIDEDEIIEDDDVSSIGSDEEFFGIENEGGGKSKKTAANAESDDESSGSVKGIRKSDIAQNTNYFLNRLHERDPVLFLKRREGKFKRYSRACPVMRQPVVLSDDEFKEVNEADKKAKSKSYTNAIKYGSSKDDDKKNWFICPRFWCLKTNTSMTKEQIENGECGTNMDQVHEFTDEKHISNEKDSKGEKKYIHHTPGFLDEANPDYCVPCCFTRWDSELHKGRRKQCIADSSHIIENVESDKKKTKNKPKAPNDNKPKAPQPDDKYEPDRVLDSLLYPIDNGKWAQAQFAIQRFMQIHYKSQLQTSQNYVEDNVQTFLRYGIEQINDKKSSLGNSILGCFADLYSDVHKKDLVSIQEFIDILTGVNEKDELTITIDDFVKYGNGTFQSIFLPTNLIDENNIDIEVHIKSNLYNSFETKYKNEGGFLTNIDHRLVFVKIVAAYNNFMLFLKNSVLDIDHTYLWDVVSTPNPNIFPKGINLVIMETPNNDTTDNVDVLCPTNAYSKNLFDENKPTLFLAKFEKLFEPIYGYKVVVSKDPDTGKDKKKTKITRTFDMKTPISSNISRVLKMLNNTVNNICKPHKSLPTKYLFKNPILLTQIKDELDKLKADYTVRGQVINYHGKIIALTILKTGEKEEVYVPSHPSAPLDNIPIIFMDEETLWTTYEKTTKLLRELNHASKGAIPCLPRMKIIEEGVIVGILTDTNQFIQVFPVLKTRYDKDGLISIEDKNYILNDDFLKIDDEDEDRIEAANSSILKSGFVKMDKEITTSISKDENRVKMVRNISLENDFYTIFRATVKSVLNEQNLIRTKVIELISNRTMRYKDRLEKIVRMFQKMMKDHIEFSNNIKHILDDIYNFSKTPYNCAGTKSAIYKNGCTLIVSDTNLISPSISNSKSYYYRIADEILRYGKIQQFMIYPKRFLNISNTEYIIENTEYIIIESFLFSRDYFSDMTEFKMNEQIQNIPFTISNPDPHISQNYSNAVTLLDQSAFEKTNLMENVNRCVKKIKIISGNINRNYWRNVVFKKTTQEIEFTNTIECSFGVLYYILQDFYKRQVPLNEIRKMIWEGYRDLWENEKYQKTIKTILIGQGKGQTMTSNDLETSIMSESYFVTVLDIWIIAQKFNIPIVLFSPNANLKQTNIGRMFPDPKHPEIKTQYIDPAPHQFQNSWIVMGKNKGASDNFYFVYASSDEFKTKNVDVVPEISMIYGSFKLEELDDLEPKMRNALTNGNEYGVRARNIQSFFDDMNVVIAKNKKK
jgi:hypothetical protein